MASQLTNLLRGMGQSGLINSLADVKRTGNARNLVRGGVLDQEVWNWYNSKVGNAKTQEEVQAVAARLLPADLAASKAAEKAYLAANPHIKLTSGGAVINPTVANPMGDPAQLAYNQRLAAMAGNPPAPAATVNPNNPEQQFNIINPSTGQKGYQTPGAPIPNGWQAIGGSSSSSNNPGAPATDIATQTPPGQSFRIEGGNVVVVDPAKTGSGAGAAGGTVSANIPIGNLQPGATGAEVKKLQDYLVSKGYMTQAQVNTGYGTYGPQTTAAVKKLQTDLGVDNTSGPGFWGPKTIAAVNARATSSVAASHPVDETLKALLDSSKLSPDQKTMVEQIYGAISNNDKATSDRLKAAFEAATQFSDPYFRAQALIITDALSRALDADEGDAAYQETKLKSTLDVLMKTIDSSKEYLSFGHAQELTKLAKSFEKDLEDTRTNLASLGKTSSSVRSKSEQLLSEDNQGLVESAKKTFTYQTGTLARQGTAAERDYSRDLGYLKDKAVRERINKLRLAESKVGSEALKGLGYEELLGGIGGELERQKVADALSFSSSAGFIF